MGKPVREEEQSTADGAGPDDVVGCRPRSASCLSTALWRRNAQSIENRVLTFGQTEKPGRAAGVTSTAVDSPCAHVGVQPRRARATRYQHPSATMWGTMTRAARLRSRRSLRDRSRARCRQVRFEAAGADPVQGIGVLNARGSATPRRGQTMRGNALAVTTTGSIRRDRFPEVAFFGI